MSVAAFLPVLADLIHRRVSTASAAMVELEHIIAEGRAIATALADEERGATDRVAVPFARVLSTALAIEAFVASYFDGLDYPPELFDALRAAERGLFDLQVLRRSFADQTRLNAGADSAVMAGTRSLIPYQIRQGDTLERIALAFLGDVNRLWEILELNDLVYPFLVTDRDYHPPDYEPIYQYPDYLSIPYVDRTGIPNGVKVTGELLWLPADAAVTPGATATFTAFDVELFGRDFRIDEGHLVFDAQGDSPTVEGKDNIIQALRQRLATLKGELVLHPGYGMDRFLAVGIEATRANVVLSGLDVARTVKQDPRVTRVRNLHILFENTTSKADMVVELIGPHREFPLNAVIPETVSVQGGIAV